MEALLKLLSIDNLILDCVLLCASLAQSFFVLQSVPAPLLSPLALPPVSSPHRGKWLGKATHTPQALSIQQCSPAKCWCELVCREGQCVSAALWRTVGEGAVCVCRVLGSREVGEEKHGKKKLPFAFRLPSRSGIAGERSCPHQEQGTDVGKDRYPHPCLPTTD